MPPFKSGVISEHKPGGYPRLTCGPQRHVFVHVLVAQAMLGRELREDEHVHHKDGNTKNPHWSNLLVMDKTKHNAVSNRQYWYLKQHYAREEAAWRAYLDVMGETYEQTESVQMHGVSEPTSGEGTEGVSEMLCGESMDERNRVAPF